MIQFDTRPSRISRNAFTGFPVEFSRWALNTKMMKKHILILTGWLVLPGLALSVRAAEVNVFAAASLTDSLRQIATAYEKQSGDKIMFNFGASSTLARQIEAGVPADIFFSADEAKMDGLEKKGLIDPATRKSRLGNSLVVVVPADSTLSIQSARDLTNTSVERIALADPKAVPAGVYAKAWLEQQHLWSVMETKVVPTENVRAALAAVESGNVEAGIVYKTDAGISKKVKVAYEVPLKDAPEIIYPLALVKEGGQPKAAQKFLQYLESADASNIFEKFGFSIRQ
jgi:molybdate transport system substrate-binding protein